ncbi:MAG TPA: hypothetical protein VGX97_05355 [bacterium]|nr:hypothetical protein [bacterium]
MLPKADGRAVKHWRSGAAIVGILATNSYGSRLMAGVLLEHRGPRARCAGVLALIHPDAALGVIVAGRAEHDHFV